MIKKILTIVLIVLFSLTFTIKTCLAASQAADFLLEVGESFYRSGRYEDAAMEFRKVLLIDPRNELANKYLKTLANRSAPKPIVSASAMTSQTNRDDVMEKTIAGLLPQPITASPVKYSTPIQDKPHSGIKIKGEAQLGLGIDTRDTIWKRSNFDLNEENWRTLTDKSAYNNRYNTYDPRIFDRLRVNVDTDNQEGLGFHTDITIDPWSFTGKGPKTTVTSGWGDYAEIELKYWSNTGYTIPETVYTQSLGNSFSLPETKVGKYGTDAFTTYGAYWPSDTFNIPETKIQRDFQPLRELWVDYKNDVAKVRFFPMAYQTQALTSDDPLRLTNNHAWWEASPWLYKWRGGILNTNAGPPVDFTPGAWDDQLAALTKDSDATYLTALRGFSFEFNPQDGTELKSTLAAPKGLWQDYSEVDNVITASRFKQRIGDRSILGFTHSMRAGLNLDDNSKIDSRNNVFGTDLSLEVKEGTKISLEAATSQTQSDITSPGYRRKWRGNSFYFSLVNRYPSREIIDSSYDDLKADKGETMIVKSRFYAAHMDEGFTPALSNYKNTRKDSQWSRHLTFRKPFEYYYAGIYSAAMSWNDIKPFGIGDGIDSGRDAFGFRIETLWPERLENLFDVRNVHLANGKFVENVARDEITLKVTDKLTAKGLALYQYMPKTTAGEDPFLYDAVSGRLLINDQIRDADDPSLKTGSLGLEYAFYDWLALNGVWEHTNDYTLAYDNYPRGILNSANRAYLYWENSMRYREMNSWLYSQGLFPNAPYPFYDIFKAGLRINPIDKMEVYFDYTRNEFESAGPTSDNINHAGVEIGYLPTEKLGLYLKYVYSRWKDLERLQQGITTPAGHHNFFAELRYHRTSDDELILQYGESGYTPIGAVTFDPFGGSLSVLDIQHIIRLYYRRKF
ncbi:MAG: hypothetical protein KKE64_05020 [Candidatus Omnitrophica bacterium]|nr:hypothetical protein [Candidatus Omnitrophota bacterium]